MGTSITNIPIKNILRSLKTVWLGLIFSGLSSCTTTNPSSSNAFWIHYRTGQYEQASTKIGQISKEESSTRNRLLWALQEMVMHYWAGDFKRCIKAGERAEQFIQDFEDRPSVNLRHLLTRVGVMMSNETVSPYRGQVSDKIMLHTIKAMAYLMDGQTESAMVELKNAEARRQWAFEHHQRSIRSLMEGEKKSSKAHASGKKESASTDKVLQSQAYQKAVDRHYGILEDLPHYRDFSNPLAMFLDAAVHGARTTNRSSLEHASASLGTLKGMLEDSSFDPFIKELDQRFNGKTATPWVHMVIERGLAPRKISQSLDIPILINGHITGIHLAFPALSPQPLDGNKTKILKMEQPLEATILCDIDAIQMRELKTQLRATIWAQVASAGFKTFLEVQLAEQDPSLGILGYLINSSLNIADTRSWNALPKHIEVISVPYQDSSIKLNIGHQNLEIKGLSSQFDQLVHIKSLDGPLHYQITDLKDPYLASTRLDSTN